MLDRRMKLSQPNQRVRRTSGYLPELDVVRLIAFFAVFLHHLPGHASLYATTARAYGWAGVDLFFVLSSYLFFSMLDREYALTGSINVRNFFIRRVMRIYPLMIAFPIMMLVIYGAGNWTAALSRLAGIALMLDDIITWFAGYNGQIRYSAHLWTLSYEFQVYLSIPLLFILWKRLGDNAFIAVLSCFLLYAVASRTTVYLVGAKHPSIWVTPFLRPDSVLFGLALAVVKPRWDWRLSLGVALVGLYIFVSIGRPWDGLFPNIFSYLVLAVVAASIVDISLRSPFARLVAMPQLAWLVFLGRISFGLYVFHILAISLTEQWLPVLWRPLNVKFVTGDYMMFLVVAFGLTIALSVVSYYAMERRVDRWKRRFEIVHGRP